MWFFYMWVLSVKGGGGVSACLDGLGHFFPCPDGQILVLGGRGLPLCISDPKEQPVIPKGAVASACFGLLHLSEKSHNIDRLL